MRSIRHALLILTVALTFSGITSASYAEYSIVTSIKDIKPQSPEMSQTPGHLCTSKDKDFKGYRYSQKIPYCERNVDYYQKSQIYQEYGVTPAQRSQYTIDHFIPLSIGGSNDPRNLWPEHKQIKALRQNLEMELFTAVRDGHMTRAEAIDIIRNAKLHPPVDSFMYQ